MRVCASLMVLVREGARLWPEVLTVRYCFSLGLTSPQESRAFLEDSLAEFLLLVFIWFVQDSRTARRLTRSGAVVLLDRPAPRKVEHVSRIGWRVFCFLLSFGRPSPGACLADWPARGIFSLGQTSPEESGAYLEDWPAGVLLIVFILSGQPSSILG